MLRLMINDTIIVDSMKEIVYVAEPLLEGFYTYDYDVVNILNH